MPRGLSGPVPDDSLIAGPVQAGTDPRTDCAKPRHRDYEGTGERRSIPASVCHITGYTRYSGEPASPAQAGSAD